MLVTRRLFLQLLAILGSGFVLGKEETAESGQGIKGTADSAELHSAESADAGLCLFPLVFPIYFDTYEYVGSTAVYLPTVLMENGNVTK